MLAPGFYKFKDKIIRRDKTYAIFGDAKRDMYKEEIEKMERTIRIDALNKYFTTFRKTPVGGRLVPNFHKTTHRDQAGLTKLKIQQQEQNYRNRFKKLTNQKLKPINKKLDLIGHIGEYGHTDFKT